MSEPIRFERWMQHALHDPEHGYYSRHVKTVGRRGDFSTTATLHGALGEVISSWAGERDLIEVGGGDGSLAAGVLGAMGWWRRSHVRFHMVEASPPLEAQQRERLRRFGRRVQWHPDMQSALAACGGVADLFSNELVDAFPAQALRWDAAMGRWEELGVDGDGTLLAVGASEFTCDWRPADGQRIERHGSYREWLEAWLPSWRRGRMLTIDYGGEFPELYHRRPNGTLRAYFAQMRLDQPGEFFERAGRQDLTADVDFSALRSWGIEGGLSRSRLMGQRQFMLEQKPTLAERARKDPALAFLLDEDGAGGAFLVLEQRREDPS